MEISDWTAEKRTLEFDGGKYAEASEHQKEWGSRLIAELKLTGRERILDLGCGDGNLTAQLAARVPDGHVLGIDASSGMLQAARRHESSNLRFQRKDIRDLDFLEEFDVVFSNATLHWVGDHERLLDDIFRSLRNDGFVRLNFAGDGNCEHFLRVVREAVTHPRFSQHFRDFVWPWYMPSLGQYMGLAARSRFREIRVWMENADRTFADSESMIRWVDQPSLVPFLACVPEVDKGPFREVVVRRMIEETHRSDGTCFETFRRINVYARK
jgi:trans-aconitate 2-methyltransferase